MSFSDIYSDRYNISKLVAQSIGVSYGDLFISLTRKAERMDEIKNVKKHVEALGLQEYEFKNYRNFVGKLLYFLHNGAIINTYSAEIKAYIKPIAESLVEQGHLLPSVLEGFQE